MTRVLVTDAGRGSAISIIRSLGRRGIEVVAADAHPRSPGFFTRYSTGKVLYPSPTRRAPEAVETLVRAAAERRIDLLIPVGEELVTLLSAERARFAEPTVLALPDAAALDAARDKRASVELAERLGIPTPRTVLVRSAAEAAREAPAFRWPVVLKPQWSRSVTGGRVDAFGVAYATNIAALEAQMRTFEGRCPVLLQEYCPGEGHGVGLLMRNGEALLAFQHRRLREVPLTGGPSSLRESVALDPVLLDHSVRLLGALRWTGPAMVEFKLAADGAKLMEINGRIWGSLPLAVKSGVDVPIGIVSVFLDRPRGSSNGLGRYALGVRSRDLRLELRWIRSVLAGNRRESVAAAPRRREAVAAAWRLLDPHDGYDILSWRDPLPGVAELVDLAGAVARRAVGSRDGAPR